MLKMSKEDATRVAGVIKLAADQVRKVTAERDVLARKVAALETSRRVDSVVEKMSSIGASNPFRTHEALVEALYKKAADGTLDVFEQALEMSPNLSVARMGEVLEGQDKHAAANQSSEQSKAELDAFVLG